MRCYSRNSTHTCNQWEFNTKCQSFMHVEKPKDQDLAGHAITKSISILLWLFKTTRTSKKLSPSLFPWVHMNLNSHLTLLSFSFKKRARSTLESSLKPTGQHLKRKIKLHLISSSYSLKETRRLKYSLKLSTSHIFGSSH